MASAERSYRLLIVDDDEVDRRLYSRLLTRQEPGAFEIEQTSDGVTGLAALRAQTPDCVLLDFNLPDMTGLEFLGERCRCRRPAMCGRTDSRARQ